MSKLLFCTRNDVSKHIVLRNYISLLKKNGTLVDTCRVKKGSIRQLIASLCDPMVPLILVDDPIAFMFSKIVSPSKRIVFLSLEMFEHQIRWKGARNIARNLLFYVLHRLSLEFADWVVFSNTLRRDFYLKKHRLLASKSCVVKNKVLLPEEWPFLGGSLEMRIGQFRQKFNILVVYAGSLQEGRSLGHLVEALREALDIGMVLIESTNIATKMPEMDNLLCLRNLSHQDVMAIYKYCDVGILNYANDPLNVRFCAPVKIFEYAAAGLKIVANENYSMMSDELVNGIYTDKESVVTLIRSLCSSGRKTPDLDQVSFDLEFDRNIRPIISSFMA